MIFTGVTGGEIISLLYPLFILSPFCYIIISKESLDGTSSVVPWCGSLSSPAKNHGLVYRGRACGHIIFVCLYFDDRNDGFGVSGNGDVFVSHRSRSFRQTL